MHKRSGLFTIAMALTFLAVPLNSQQTWNGFRFGMTLAEVKSRVPLVKDEEPGWYRGPTITLRTLPFTERFVFGPRLNRITLSYDTFDADPDTRLNAADLIGEFAADLSAKYGRPVDVHGACDVKDQRELSAGDCKQTWSYRGQAITLSANGTDGRILLLVIGYTPQESKL